MNFGIEKYEKKKQTPLWVGFVAGVFISVAILSVTFYVVSLGDPLSVHVEQS